MFEQKEKSNMDTYKIYLDVSHNISHIGSDVRGIGVENVMEWIHSDTLFSAIIHAWAELFGREKTDDLINEFLKFNSSQDERDLPFRISSAFLAYKNSKNGFIDFVPMPLCPPPGKKELPGLEKIKFISWENLLKWLNIEQINWEDEDIVKEYIHSLNQDGKLYSRRFINRVRAVNAKDRIRNQTQVYHRGETIYSANTYLHFRLDIQNNYLDRLKQAINYIKKYAGIGGEINIGFSQINETQIIPFKSIDVTEPKNYYLLSMMPIHSNIIYDESFYDIVNKKSWFRSPFHEIQLKKKTVKMLRAGSCLKCSNILGKLIDVTPKLEKEQEKWTKEDWWHPIYRNGIGYGIGY